MKVIASAAVIAVTNLVSVSTQAFEFGYAGFAQKPGLVVGNAAVAPPPGIYMFNQAYTAQAKLVGPGAPSFGGGATAVQVAAATSGILWVPGWTFLGGEYNAVGVLPFVMDSVGAPINTQQAGVHNTYIVPVELSWRIGDNGLFVKAGLGIYAPDGSISGVNGLANVGNPWWTFQPGLVVSYLKDGWNLTANMFVEINTENSITKYKSGDLLHAEFTATKTTGQWTVGPVAYYMGQVGNDRSSSFYNGAINVNRYDVWGAGALIGYNFGPATLNLWAIDEVYARGSGGTAGPGIDSAVITKGWNVYASLSYRLWAPDAPSAAPTTPLLRK